MVRLAAVSIGLMLALSACLLWPRASAASTNGTPAPDIAGENWLNSKPLTISGLKGRVVLVEFWTFGCVNCKNIIPHLRTWHDKYYQAGLTIVGVHSPEFPWEKPFDKMQEATERLAIKFPVVQDNNFDIWQRYNIWAWPTIVLVDKKGVIRYSHIGEGAYGKTESTIKQLLSEQG
jgi:thiol-disulfide isomerase/thioredoxin